VSGHETVAAPAVTDRGRRRRAALLDAAERLFVTQGFHAVSVDDLGAAAGITGPGLYRHFASKDAILMAVLDRVWERLAPVVADAERLAPAPALERLLIAHLDLAMERAAALELLFRELERLPEEYRELARRNHRRYVAAWTTAIAGTRPDLEQDAARMIALAVHGLLDAAALRGEVQPSGLATGARRALLEDAARRVLAV